MTTKPPLVAAVQDRVEDPEPVTLVGVRVHIIPLVGLIVAVRLTIPTKPLMLVRVIVDAPELPT